MAAMYQARLAPVVVMVAALGGAADSLSGAAPQQSPKVGGLAGTIAIIVNRSNPVTELTRDELRRIFMQVTQTWPHGRKITVVLGEKGEPLRAHAIQLICGISESDFERYLLFQTFGGTIGLGPRTIRSPGAMIRFVFNAPGAVGYVPGDQIDKSVKVLRIGGMLPGDPGYPLRVPPSRTPGTEWE